MDVDENSESPSFMLTTLGVILVTLNSMKATDGDVVVRYVLVQPCLCEAHQTALQYSL